MIENYSNLMYQNMANQRQQGAPPPPGTDYTIFQNHNDYKYKYKYLILCRRQTRVWKPEGLKSRGPWTFLVLEASPHLHD